MDVIIDGFTIRVPLAVEAEGGEAVHAYVAQQLAARLTPEADAPAAESSTPLAPVAE
jgi:hypothetical protein